MWLPVVVHRSLTLFRQGTVCFLLADPLVDALAK